MSDQPPENSGPRPVIEPERLRRFLRYSHIFSAVVREVLEARYIADVSEDPLTLHQFHVLLLMNLNGHHKVGEIADFLGVSSPAATKNIDKLERLGLVTRQASRHDRRVTLLSASPRGRRLVGEYEELKTRRLGPILARFDPDEIDRLVDLMQSLSVLLFEKEGAEEEFCLRCAAYGEENCPIGHVLGNCPYQKIRERGNDKRRSAEQVPAE